MRIAVESDKGGGIELPRSFRLNGHRVEVAEIIDQWFGSDYRYCKVRDRDGALYILRFDENRSEWHLTMFASPRAQSLPAMNTGPRPRGLPM